MHVSTHNQSRYLHLKKIADLLYAAGDLAGAEFMNETHEAYALARKFHNLADELTLNPHPVAASIPVRKTASPSTYERRRPSSKDTRLTRS